MRPGGHGIIFCSALQFQLWYDAFSFVIDNTEAPQSDSEDEFMDRDGSSESSDDRSPKCTREEDRKFMVDPAPMVFVDIPGHFYGVARIKNTSLYRSSEFAVHVVKKGLKREEAFALVDHSNFNYISSTHYPHVNVIDNIPRLDVGNGSESLIPRKVVR